MDAQTLQMWLERGLPPGFRDMYRDKNIIVTVDDAA